MVFSAYSRAPTLARHIRASTSGYEPVFEIDMGESGRRFKQSTKPSGYDLPPHIPVIGARFPVQREGIEHVGEEDLGKSLIA